MGAIRVLLHMPAIPPEMKLFNILYFFFGYCDDSSPTAIDLELM